MKVIEIGIVELVQRSDVTQQFGFMTFEVIGDDINLFTYVFILLDEFRNRRNTAK